MRPPKFMDKARAFNSKWLSNSSATDGFNLNRTVRPLPSRSVGAAYGLWALSLFGFCGAHRFYLGKLGTGGIWFFTFGGLFIGQIVDLFLIPGMVSEFNKGQLEKSPSLQTSRPVQGQALMRAIIQLAQSQGGVLTVTQTIGQIEADFDEIEQAFLELTRRGYADPENNLITGAVEYRFPELIREATSIK